MLKPISITGIFKDMNLLIVRRNPMNVFNMMKPLQKIITIRYIKTYVLDLCLKLVFKYKEEHRLENKSMMVTNAVKPLLITVIFKSIKEYKLDRNPMNVTNVAKPLHVPANFKSIKEHILEKNPMNVPNVVKPFHAGVIFKDIKQHIVEKKCYECNQFSKPFVEHYHLQIYKRTHTGEKP